MLVPSLYKHPQRTTTMPAITIIMIMIMSTITEIAASVLVHLAQIKNLVIMITKQWDSARIVL